MKTTTLSFLISTAMILISTPGWTKIEYDSNALMMKNAEQMATLVQKKIKKALQIQAKTKDADDDSVDPEAIDQLRDAMRIVLSRPDQEGALSNLFGRLRRELTDLGSYEEVMRQLVDEGLLSLKGTTDPRSESTYIVILQNVMREMKPDINSNPDTKKLIAEIRDANIKITDEQRKQLLLRSMTKPVSPSETAAALVPKDEKKKK